EEILRLLRLAPAAGAADLHVVGDIDESAAVVAEEPVAADARDEDVDPAVVVKVATGHAHAIHLHLEPGLLGDILEGAVALVAVELKRGLAALTLAGPGARID